MEELGGFWWRENAIVANATGVGEKDRCPFVGRRWEAIDRAEEWQLQISSLQSRISRDRIETFALRPWAWVLTPIGN